MITTTEQKKFLYQIQVTVRDTVRETMKEYGFTEQNGDVWVTTKEAAHILGITESHMRRIKNSFPHKKRGDQQQGQLMFLKSKLYECYLDGEAKNATKVAL